MNTFFCAALHISTPSHAQRSALRAAVSHAAVLSSQKSPGSGQCWEQPRSCALCQQHSAWCKCSYTSLAAACLAVGMLLKARLVKIIITLQYSKIFCSFHYVNWVSCFLPPQLGLQR